MARVTIRNNLTSTYVVPSPFGVKLGAAQSRTFDGISLVEMEQSAGLKEAIAASNITVTVAADPTIPDVMEISPSVTSQTALSAQGGNLRTDEFTNPVVADVNAIKLSVATAAALQTFSGTALDGVVGQGEMVPPRNPTITSTLHADVTAVAVVLTGYVRDASGALVSQTCTITTTNGGGVTDAGDRPMSVITSISVPAMGGPGGALEFGFGAMLGLSAVVVSRAGLLAPLREIAVGAVVTTGTFTTASGSAVTGYVPAAAPDGARDYAATYEAA